MNLTKIKKHYLIFFLIPIFLFSSSIEVNAQAASLSMSASSKSINIGDTVSVTVKGSAGGREVLSTVTVNYNPSVLEYVSDTEMVTNAGNGRLTYSTTGVTITFKAIGPGNAGLTASGSDGVELSNPEATYDTLSGTSASVTVAAPVQYSKDNSLKSLKVSPGTLSPAFNPSTTKYSVTVPNNTTKLTVDATASHSAAKVVSVTGADSLKVGNNEVKIVVQAEDGSNATYTITVTREQGASAPTTAPTQTEPTATPTPNPSPTPEPELPPIEVKVDDKPLFISSDFESTSMPESFRKETFDYGDREIEVAVSNDGELTLVYLIEENKESGDFFIYNKETDSFSPYNEIEGRGGRYIILPLEEGVTIPESFVETSFSYEGKDISGWQLEALEDEEYYIVYAMDGRGSKGLYSFDLKEVTFQRFSVDALNALLSGKTSDEDLVAIKDDLDKTKDDLTKLQGKYNLDMNSRLQLMIALAVVAVILLVLLVNVLLRNRFLKQDLVELEEYLGQYDKEDEFDLADSLTSTTDDLDFIKEFAASKEDEIFDFEDEISQELYDNHDNTSVNKEVDNLDEEAYKPSNEVNEAKEVSKDNKVKDLENASLEDIFEFLNVDELDDDDVNDDLI